MHVSSKGFWSFGYQIVDNLSSKTREQIENMRALHKPAEAKLNQNKPKTLLL